MRPVDEAVRLSDPEVVHCLPVAYHDGPLVAEAALVDGRSHLLCPFREDGRIILTGPAAKEMQVPDKGQT